MIRGVAMCCDALRCGVLCIDVQRCEQKLYDMWCGECCVERRKVGAGATHRDLGEEKDQVRFDIQLTQESVLVMGWWGWVVGLY